MPGCQVITTVIDKDGNTVAHNEIWTTPDGKKGPGPRRGAAAYRGPRGAHLRELPQQPEGAGLRHLRRPLPHRQVVTYTVGMSGPAPVFGPMPLRILWMNAYPLDEHGEARQVEPGGEAAMRKMVLYAVEVLAAIALWWWLHEALGWPLFGVLAVACAIGLGAGLASGRGPGLVRRFRTWTRGRGQSKSRLMVQDHPALPEILGGDRDDGSLASIRAHRSTAFPSQKLIDLIGGGGVSLRRADKHLRRDRGVRISSASLDTGAGLRLRQECTAPRAAPRPRGRALLRIRC